MLPNARATIIESAKVGQNVIERDVEKARERDARLAAMQAELAKAKGQKALIAFRVPGLAARPRWRAANGARGAGDAFPQARVRRNGTAGRFDDVAGRGFMIIARGMDTGALGGGSRVLAIARRQRRAARRGGAVEDADGSYTQSDG